MSIIIYVNGNHTAHTAVWSAGAKLRQCRAKIQKRSGIQYGIIRSQECEKGIYGQTGSGQGTGAERREFLSGGRRVCGDHGRVGFRQDDAVKYPGLSG